MSLISKIIGILTVLLGAILIGLLGYTQIIPFKYFICIILVITFISIGSLFLVFRKKSKTSTLLIVTLCNILLLVLFQGGFQYIFKTYHFIDSINNVKEESDRYQVIVLKKSSYTNIEDIKDKTIGVYKDSDPVLSKALKQLTEKVSYQKKEYIDIKKMANDLLEHKQEIIFIKEGYKTVLEEELDTFKDSVRVLYTVTVKTKMVQPTIALDPLKEPFNLFISGIDVYGDVMTKSQGDVNIVVTVNPVAHEILLTVIPRDYYVPLHGMGVKDKLTHAAYYGINMSIGTVEDLLATKIPYYVRVNFDTVIKVVDVIGGIDIYSDKSFRPWTNGKLYIKKGMNHMDGKTALAFSRERMSYASGDRHRGQNQQAVLTAIMKKIASSKTLLTKYGSILDTLSGSFMTNMETSTMTSFVNQQIGTMAGWNIKSYNVNGTDSYNMAYSLGIKRYVMEPNMNTVQLAQTYIKAMTNGQTFAQIGL